MPRRSLRYGVAVVVVYIVSWSALWFGYSTRAQINGGNLSVAEAQSLVSRMATITTLLCVAAIAFGRLILRPRTVILSTLQAGSCAGLVLIAYTAANVLWRGSWEPMSGRSAFLPLWGGVNAHFFREYYWLDFLLFVTPLITATACTAFWWAASRRALRSQ